MRGSMVDFKYFEEQTINNLIRFVFIKQVNSFKRKELITIIDELVFHLICLTIYFDIFRINLISKYAPTLNSTKI